MKIYDKTGSLIVDVEVDDSSVRYRSIMTDDSLTLNFSLPYVVSIPVLSYVMFDGQRYTLWRPQEFKKHGARIHEYTLVLHGWREYLKFVKFKDMSAKPYRLKFSLTAKPVTFLQNLVACLNDHDLACGWAVGDCIDAPDKALSFNHEYCIDVIGRMAQEWQTEYEFEGKTIHLRKVEKFKDAPLALTYGKGNGFLPGVGRYNEGDRQPVGKLFVQGGERNIDFSTYGSKSLLLPKSATLVVGGKSYSTDAYGMYITRDGGTNAAEDSYDASEIYPQRVGTVSEVIVVNEEDNLYDVKDSSIPEALNYRDCRIAGERAIIRFETGALAGREFDILQSRDDLTGYIHAERRFKIVPQELDGVVMPGGVFVPTVGDKYAIFNISLPQAYISDDATQTGASWDMFREAVRYFIENETDRFRFTGELDGVWSKSRWLEIGGKIVPGGHVLFSDEQFQPSGVVIRIVAVKNYVNKPHKPEITLSNAPVPGSFSSSLAKLEADEVVIEEAKKEVIRFTKRQWRDARETMEMLANSLLGDFDKSINPITVQTMQMIVGDESLQFRFVNSKTNPVQVSHAVSFNPGNKQLTAPAGILQHMTLGITTLTTAGANKNYKFWDMTAYTSPPLTPETGYYLYAKCEKEGPAGAFLLSETAISMENIEGCYHFLVGILNSEREDGSRSFAPLYGFTEVLPGRVITNRIESQDGVSYFDLLNGIIAGKIRFVNADGEYEELEQARDGADGTEIHISRHVVPVQCDQDGGVVSYANTGLKIIITRGSNVLEYTGHGASDVGPNGGEYSIGVSTYGVDGFTLPAGYQNEVVVNDISGLTEDTGMVTLTFTIWNYTTNSAYQVQRIITFTKIRKGTDGIDGIDGDPGDGVLMRYKRSETRPATPSQSDLNPSGWLATPDSPDNVDVYDVNFEGEWTKQANGELKSKTITHNEKTALRLRFRTYQDNVTIKVTARVSSQLNYDKLHISKLDTPFNSSYSNELKNISGTKTEALTYTVTSKGEHFVDFEYAKDSSGSSGDDAAYVSIILPVRTVWITSCAVVAGAGQGWSTPRIYLDERMEDVVAKTYKSTAVTDKFGTTISGGLVSAVVLLLRALNSTIETAGISGIQGDGSLPAFWAGGTYAESIANTAKAIIRHDGSSKFTDTEIEGIITALEGFIGKLVIGANKALYLPDENGKIRFELSDASLPLLPNLLNNSEIVRTANNTGKTLTENESSYIFPNSVEVVENNSELTVTGQITALIGSPAFTGYVVGSACTTLYLINSQGNVYASTGFVTAHAPDNPENYRSINTKFYGVPKGFYRLKLVFDFVYQTDPPGAVIPCSGSVGATTMTSKFTVDKEQTIIARDGLMSFFGINKYLYLNSNPYSGSPFLVIRGGINIPGVPIEIAQYNQYGGVTYSMSAICITATKLAQGKYKVNLKSGTFSSSNDFIPEVTASAGGDNPHYAQVYSWTYNSIEVWTADDNTNNDGGFIVKIYDKRT